MRAGGALDVLLLELLLRRRDFFRQVALRLQLGMSLIGLCASLSAPANWAAARAEAVGHSH